MVVRTGANVNARTPTGWTVLMKATLWGRTEVVDLLLHYGADVKARNNDGWTALDVALEKGQRSMIRWLLAAGETSGDHTTQSSSL